LAYAVYLTRAAERDLERLPAAVQTRLAVAFQQLSENPRIADVIKLEGEDDLYRKRVGDYRLVFQLSDVPR
jgi:mRNA interferase RelE/StbE